MFSKIPSYLQVALTCIVISALVWFIHSDLINPTHAAGQYNLVKLANENTTENVVRFRNVGSGDFDATKLKVWHFDKNNPQLRNADKTVISML